MSDFLCVFECGHVEKNYRSSMVHGVARVLCPIHGAGCEFLHRVFRCTMCGGDAVKPKRSKIAGPHYCEMCRVKKNRQRQYEHKHKQMALRGACPVLGASFVPHDHHDPEYARPTVDPINGRLPGVHGLVGQRMDWENDTYPLAARR